MIVLDTETTGYSPHHDRVVEVAIVRYEDNVVLFHELINPGIPIPPELTKDVHGISDADVADKPHFADVAAEIAGIVRTADIVAGHNVFYDRGMLAAEFLRNNEQVSWPTLVCTLRLWNLNEPKEKRDLSSAFKRFVDSKGFEGQHTALQDTMATVRVLRAQVREFDLIGKKWDELDPEASTWWGPSNHVIWKNDLLLFNIGKHKGVPVWGIDNGYWKWLLGQDFPEHVKRLAEYLIHVSKDRDKLLSWAKDDMV